MQLDDWVLCRIRLKGNMSKNSWELPQSSNKVMGVVPSVKELSSVYATNTASDICSNYFLSKDCHLLAKLLATQDFPSLETDSRATSQSSNIGENSNTVYEQESIKQNQVANSFSASSFNLQGKPNDGNGYENIAPNVTNFYNQHQTHGGMFKLNLSSAIMNLQELDVSAFAEKFMH